MKTALLCPGPSLADYRTSDHEIVVGVNRAVSVAPCDFWVLLDDRPFRSASPIGEPCLVTSGAIYRRFIRKSLLTKDRPFIDRQNLYFDGNAPWGRFSATNALVLLLNMGATSIDCFGVDMVGTKDWDGFGHDQDKRDIERWKEEATLWNRLTQYLSEHGCEVVRQGVNCAA
jgi:hypothetical protein